MPKIRTLTKLQDDLDSEFAWRIKEIASLKSSVRSAGVLSQATLIRAGVALVYAHWEGFIKAAATAYISFINNQGHKYSELKSCFVFVGLKGHLHLLSETRKLRPGRDALEFVRDRLNARVNMILSNAINTESNLGSAVFLNIAETISIDATPYQSKFNLIDLSLVKRRNRIAHGEFCDLDAEEWRTLADEVLQIMRHFKTDIENAATLESYLA